MIHIVLNIFFVILSPFLLHNLRQERTSESSAYVQLQISQLG